MKYIFLAGITTFTLCTQANAQNFADVHLTHITPIKEEATWLREKQFSPMYPKELAMKGIAGCGVFKIFVDEDGNTDSVDLISAVPKRDIAKPAAKVIKSWTWLNAKGTANIAEEKIIRLDFCMGGSTQEEAKQRCIAQSLVACEG
jgi:protein TonB